MSTLDHANALLASGDLAGARTAAEAAVSEQPASAEALNTLGNVLQRLGEESAAESTYKRAIALEPAFFKPYGNLGALEAGRGNHHVARDLFLAALARNPRSFRFQTSLGNTLRGLGDAEGAIEAYRASWAIQQNRAAGQNLGSLLGALGQDREAVAALTDVLTLDPTAFDAHLGRGLCLDRLGDAAGSDESFFRAAELSPPEAALTVAERLARRGRADALAVLVARIVTEASSNSGAPVSTEHYLLDKIVATIGWFRPSILERVLIEAASRSQSRILVEKATLRLAGTGAVSQAVQLARDQMRRGGNDSAYVPLMHSLALMGGDATGARALLEAGLAKAPLDPGLRSLDAVFRVAQDGNVDTALRMLDEPISQEITPIAPHGMERAALLQFAEGSTKATLRLDAIRWAETHPVPPSRPRAQRPRGRLRVGYLSSQFNGYSRGTFFEALFRGHDRRRFEIYVYSATHLPDDATARWTATDVVWRDCIGWSDNDIADQVARDGIDILVELDGLRNGSRIAVCRQRPAPLQIRHLGTPGTSGFSEISYRIADYDSEPVGDSERWSTERLLRMPASAWCFATADLPPLSQATENEAPTFACFAPHIKLQPSSLAAFARILAGVSRSTLRLKAAPDGSRAFLDRVYVALDAAGVSRSRVEIVPWTGNRFEDLSAYSSVDVALDASPVSAKTSLCQALSMGVPVVSLLGDRHGARAGASLLRNAGLHDFVASSWDAFEQIAIALATDRPRRRDLRATLRTQFLASSVCDAATYVRALEDLYLDAWTVAGPIGETRNSDELVVRVDNATQLVLARRAQDLPAWLGILGVRWRPDEARFLGSVIDPGDSVVDLDAGHGFATCVLAKLVGPSGAVFACESDTVLREQLRLNMVAGNVGWVRVVSDPPSQDELLADKRLSLLRLSTRVDSSCSEALRSEHLQADGYGIILLDAPIAETVSDQQCRDLRALGYDLFRLLPSLESLVPYENGELKPRVVFGLKPKRVAELERRQLLIRAPALFDVAVDLECVKQWKTQRPYLEAAPLVEAPLPRAIQLFASAESLDETTSPSKRWGYFEAAAAAAREDLATNPSLWRRLTLARTLLALGNETEALPHVRQALNQLDVAPPGDIEPFLALVGSYERLDCTEGVHELAAMQARELIARLTGFAESGVSSPRFFGDIPAARFSASAVRAHAEFFHQHQHDEEKRAPYEPAPSVVEKIRIASEHGLGVDIATVVSEAACFDDCTLESAHIRLSGLALRMRWVELAFRFASAGLAACPNSITLADLFVVAGTHAPTPERCALLARWAAHANVPIHASMVCHALEALHDKDAMWELARSSLARFPESETLALGTANAAFQRKRFDDVWELLGRVKERRRTRAHAAVLAAQMQLCLGENAAATAALDEAMALTPDRGALYVRHYDPAASPYQLEKLHREWGAFYARTRKPSFGAIERTRDRPLRVGYISGDFGAHAAACFSLPLIEAHRPSDVLVYCYSTRPKEDRVTSRFRKASQSFRNVAGLADEELARLIADDRIDVLVDLSGHTEGNALTMFAHRPAPIQATYLGYPNTTGVPAIDFRFTDPWADPPERLSFCTEELIRLPRCAWSFHPIGEAPHPELRDSGAVVFGTFNNFAKVNPLVLAVWARILVRVPESRLYIKGAPLVWEPARERVYARLEGAGVARSRVQLVPHTETGEEHLQAYSNIDIALDPFPYNGTTTTCEALWMGVPVVTIVGDRHSARVGSSLLHGIGLDDLVATTEEEYVNIAANLANDPDRRRSLRRTLRDRMLNNPLGQPESLARAFEAEYRRVWHRWLDGAGKGE